jgi:hypothetical protein
MNLTESLKRYAAYFTMGYGTEIYKSFTLFPLSKLS